MPGHEPCVLRGLFAYPEGVSMLKANSISKRFGERAVLGSVSFIVNSGECAGVVAHNGAGKTTLLQIIAGEIAPDAGAVEVSPAHGMLAYVRQGFVHVGAQPVAEVFPSLFGALQADDALADAAEAIARAEDELGTKCGQALYDAAIEVATDGSVEITADWEALRLRPVAPNELVGALSGGEQTKLALLDAFALRCDILLLDEPTNDLGIQAAAWLTDRLHAFGRRDRPRIARPGPAR